MLPEPELPEPERKGWQLWPGWLIAYIVTLLVLRDILLTVLQ